VVEPMMVGILGGGVAHLRLAIAGTSSSTVSAPPHDGRGATCTRRSRTACRPTA
jgi:hypothetical protein